MSNTCVETIVVGAGIAGLAAAERLVAAGREVLVVDKGRGVGGRMATRRGEGGRWDHGAQFFTARSAAMQARVDAWLAQGVVREWYDTQQFVPEEAGTNQDCYPRYCGADGMTTIVKAMAVGLNLRLRCRIQHAYRQGETWKLVTDDGEVLRCHNLLVTAPAPQARAILEPVCDRLSNANRDLLNSIAYTRCLALLLTLDGPSGLAGAGGIRFADPEPISWIGDNQQKGISEQPTVTVHAGPRYSDTHYDAADSERIPPLMAAAEPLLAASVVSVKAHRWGYALRTTEHEADLLAEASLGLWLAGDGFCAPRVEGAFLSGIAAAKAMLVR